MLETPPTDGRRAVVQLLDGFTNAAAYVGDGERGAAGERVALVPPGFTGAVPAGVRRIRMPTQTAWLLGRTLVDPGPADLAVARALPDPLPPDAAGEWTGGVRTEPLILDDFPADRRRCARRPGWPSSTRLAPTWSRTVRPRATRVRPARLRGGGDRSGPAPGRAATGARRQAAAADGPRLVDRLVAETQAASRRSGGGWTTAPGNIARFGRDFPTRAFVTEIGLGANTAEKALYPNTSVDSRGRRLHGRHVYELRFAGADAARARLLVTDALRRPAALLRQPARPLRARRPLAWAAPRPRRWPDVPGVARRAAGRPAGELAARARRPVRALPAPLRATGLRRQRSLAPRRPCGGSASATTRAARARGSCSPAACR